MKAIRTIGFTGTIASGKTSRCKRLVEVAREHQRGLEAAAAAAQAVSNKPPSHSPPCVDHTVLVHYINADLVGHNIYEPHRPCYKDVVQHFGSSILTRTPPFAGAADADGEGSGKSGKAPLSAPYIDRRVLGEIVFGDARKLQELSAICWPYITAAIRAEYAAVCARATASTPLPSTIDLTAFPALPAGPAAVALIIIEAALLCDIVDVLSLTTDLWMTHCTPETAVDRLMARNGLSSDEAGRRVASQREVDEKLQALRELSYKGDIEVFDTTQVSLAEGLEETEKAFEKYWKKKVLVHLPLDPAA
ncbi:hypothetical protein ABB37_06098 [Leptomonas pyrrhocoris]|uniref:Dephospho-CoA kinase n=1 Tax=Leptomonas pyrrhocoris TaxID=157538 RepID=A0A0M9FY31_LEPPY|nr:hypothetical protein ABB37_06098 [Leptomonas pyrrhocoris]KPA78480.1 hypothetical protein ABB37_06098 [Leptomonas pyrrhocoris]|eukprot:XP_015656919.1 hypothetical protein ABB37_06098 [Leptomonas pyrrhocoris]